MISKTNYLDPMIRNNLPDILHGCYFKSSSYLYTFCLESIHTVLGLHVWYVVWYGMAVFSTWKYGMVWFDYTPRLNIGVSNSNVTHRVLLILLKFLMLTLSGLITTMVRGAWRLRWLRTWASSIEGSTTIWAPVKPSRATKALMAYVHSGSSCM